MIFMDDVEVPAANMLPNVKGFKVGGQRTKVNLEIPLVMLKYAFGVTGWTYDMRKAVREGGYV